MLAPRLSVVETSFGLRLLAERTVDEKGTVMLRSSNYILPNAASASGSTSALHSGDVQYFGTFPSMTRHISVSKFFTTRTNVYQSRHLRPSAERKWKSINHVRTMANRYLQDREEMNGQTFAGVGYSFPIHDLFVTNSMGAISDHRTEHLTVSDIAIARARRELLRAIEQVETGDDASIRARLSKLDDFVTFTAMIQKGTDIKQLAADMATRGIYRRAAAS